jgi:hypothetical protein
MRERDELGVDVVIWFFLYSMWQCDAHCGCILVVYNMFVPISYGGLTGGYVVYLTGPVFWCL